MAKLISYNWAAQWFSWFAARRSRLPNPSLESLSMQLACSPLHTLFLGPSASFERTKTSRLTGNS